MQDGQAVGVVDGVGDRHGLAVGQDQGAGVAGLAAAAGVEHGLVQFDALGMHGDDRGAALGAIGVFVKALERGHGGAPGVGAESRP